MNTQLRVWFVTSLNSKAHLDQSACNANWNTKCRTAGMPAGSIGSYFGHEIRLSDMEQKKGLGLMRLLKHYREQFFSKRTFA